MAKLSLQLANARLVLFLLSLLISTGMHHPVKIILLFLLIPQHNSCLLVKECILVGFICIVCLRLSVIKLTKLQIFNSQREEFLWLFLNAEMTTVEGKLCQRRSQTWTGVCVNSGNCNRQCRNWEKASHGACHAQFPGFACFCYFNC